MFFSSQLGSIQRFVVYFSIGFVTLCLLVDYSNRRSNMVFVESRVDGQRYLVRKMPDMQTAADILAELRKKMTTLADHVWSIRESQDEFCYVQLEQLRRRFQPGKIAEAPPDSAHTSYSVNKEKIFMCIRSKADPTQFADVNTLVYVCLHEVSHLATVSVGHTQQFWSNFSFILREAIKIGIYKHEDYAKNPRQYCGTTISSSAFDPSTDDLEASLKLPNSAQSCR